MAYGFINLKVDNRNYLIWKILGNSNYLILDNLRNYLWNNVEIFQIWQNWRSKMLSELKKVNYKETIPGHGIVKLLKTRKSWEPPLRYDITFRAEQFELLLILHQKPWRPLIWNNIFKVLKAKQNKK